MSYRRILIIVALACLIAAAWAPAALAVNAGVRVEASSGTVAPATAVNVAAAPTFYDSDGNPYVTKKPNALAALAAAANARGFTWEAAYGGTFVTNIAGFASLPDWSEGWVFAVNGAGYPIVDVAAIAFPLKNGDQTLWAQSPDATFARGSVALVTAVDKVAYTSGEDLVITVKADDLAKVNSQADYDRYELTDPTTLQTPAEFAPVEGAALHVGSATYTTAADGTVTVTAPDDGNYTIWAEKAMDDNTWYVRSPKTLVNVAAPLEMTGVSVASKSFLPGKQKPKVACTLSRAASLKLQVRNAKNKVVWSKTVRKGSGACSYSWNGKGTNGKYVPRRASYTMRITAVDTWGRTTATIKVTLKTR